MRFATLAFCALLLPACRLGPGKFPNPQWKPSFDTTELLAGPVTFTALELDFTLTRAAWVCKTDYVLTRIPDHRDYTVNLEGFVSDPGGTTVYERFQHLELQLLDEQGRVIPAHRGEELRTRGEGAEEGTRNFTARIEIGRSPRPATLVVGEITVRLK